MTFDEWFSAEYHDEVGSVGEDGLRDLLREAWHAALATRPEERRTGCAQYETCPHGYSTRSACGACGQPTAASRDSSTRSRYE
jgi:hypothetical protein